MRRLLLLVVLNAICLSVAANVSVEARIDSIEMFIGQQVHVTVSATTDKPSAVVFPAFGSQQMIIPGVEVLGTDEVPEETIENGMRYSRIYTLTSFDANLYYLPPFEVSVDGKKYKSKSLALKVLTVNVDTTNVDQFFGIKDVQDNPFMWSDWSGIFWNSVLLLVLAVFGGYLYLRMRDNKPIIKRIRIIKRLLPHQKAMKSIEEIKSDRMTVSDNQKEYYTKLTDTLRRYIHERYGFNAMEMTSDEIIGRLMEESDRNAIDELRELFRTADLEVCQVFDAHKRKRQESCKCHRVHQLYQDREDAGGGTGDTDIRGGHEVAPVAHDAEGCDSRDSGGLSRSVGMGGI